MVQRQFTPLSYRMDRDPDDTFESSFAESESGILTVAPKKAAKKVTPINISRQRDRERHGGPEVLIQPKHGPAQRAAVTPLDLEAVFSPRREPPASWTQMLEDAGSCTEEHSVGPARGSSISTRARPAPTPSPSLAHAYRSLERPGLERESRPSAPAQLRGAQQPGPLLTGAQNLRSPRSQQPSNRQTPARRSPRQQVQEPAAAAPVASASYARRPSPTPCRTETPSWPSVATACPQQQSTTPRTSPSVRRPSLRTPQLTPRGGRDLSDPKPGGWPFASQQAPPTPAAPGGLSPRSPTNHSCQRLHSAPEATSKAHTPPEPGAQTGCCDGVELQFGPKTSNQLSLAELVSALPTPQARSPAARSSIRESDSLTRQASTLDCAAPHRAAAQPQRTGSGSGASAVDNGPSEPMAMRTQSRGSSVSTGPAPSHSSATMTKVKAPHSQAPLIQQPSQALLLTPAAAMQTPQAARGFAALGSGALGSGALGSGPLGSAPDVCGGPAPPPPGMITSPSNLNVMLDSNRRSLGHVSAAHLASCSKLGLPQVATVAQHAQPWAARNAPAMSARATLGGASVQPPPPPAPQPPARLASAPLHQGPPTPSAVQSIAEEVAEKLKAGAVSPPRGRGRLLLDEEVKSDHRHSGKAPTQSRTASTERRRRFLV